MSENKVDALIRRIVGATGIDSQNDLAKALGINRSGITHARNNNKIPDKWILKLYKAFGLNPEWIETGIGSVFLGFKKESDSEFKYVPKVKATLSAGGGSFSTDSEVIDNLCFKKEWLARKGSANSMVAMEVFGHSMEPEIKDGDTVQLAQSQVNVFAGAVYAVGLEDTILVKRLEKHPNKVVLCSDNHDYAPIFLDATDMENVRIIGKVIWSCREYR
ncbi:MAG: helix-turn-helix domain-containing protein [Desulfobacteraceae bacterium]|nr:helix-turn-helix domain-containing protein [Desulfobacteraceae bacterium]